VRERREKSLLQGSWHKKANERTMISGEQAPVAPRGRVGKRHSWRKTSITDLKGGKTPLQEKSTYRQRREGNVAVS